MKVLVVLGHPNGGKSFNRAIAEKVCRTLRELGHEPVFHDLYAENFDPILPFQEETLPIEQRPATIQSYIQDVKEARGIVFIHPNWWGTPPAILKGWIDRVFRAGFAYSFSAEGVVPHLADKIAQVFTTSNTPRDIELSVYHDPLENFWKTIVFGLTGCQSFERRNFEPIIMSCDAERADWLQEVGETIRRRFS